jgi:DHA1 family tetracycline resistance protein-like MFS transporter
MALSQATLTRLAVPRLGERRAALIGIAIAAAGYLGYATATAGWMMMAWLATWFFGAIVMPSSNSLMSKRVPVDVQGELQGAVACLFSLSSIVGPPLMTQLFGHFSAPGARVHLPGAAFFAAALLAAVCLAIYWWTTRESAASADEPTAMTHAGVAPAGQGTTTG